MPVSSQNPADPGAIITPPRRLKRNQGRGVPTAAPRPARLAPPEAALIMITSF